MMVRSLEDMESMARRFWAQGEADDRVEVEREEAASRSDALFQTSLLHAARCREFFSHRVDQLLELQSSRRSRVENYEGRAFLDDFSEPYARSSLQQEARAGWFLIVCNEHSDKVRLGVALIVRMQQLSFAVMCEASAQSREVAVWLTRARADIRKRMGRVAEHEDNRRFVIRDDEEKTFSALQASLSLQRQQISEREARSRRPATREYWDRMKTLREAAREAAVELHHRDTRDVEMKRMQHAEELRERVAHLVKVEHGGRKLWLADEADEWQLLPQLEAAERTALWAKIREAMFRRHLAERRAAVADEEPLRLAISTAEDAEFEPLRAMADQHAVEAFARSEGRLRKALQRQELVLRVQLIQQQSDQADVLLHIWPQVLALAQMQTDAREELEEEQAKGLEGVKQQFLVESIDVPFRVGARKALERIQSYCEEHYPKR
jgi:hypothetical protein